MKNRSVIISSLFLVLSVGILHAQWYGRPGDWKKYRQEVFIMMGSSHFLGDLGGRDRKGTDFSPVDLDWNMTRTAFGGGYRYQYRKWMNFAGTFNWLVLKGSDASTRDIYRNNRNLNFKNNILEIMPRIEIGYFETRLKNRYTIKKSLSTKKLKVNWSYFAYTGLSLFYHNPKGQDASGKYVKLYPLHTEGQGLPGGPKQYKRVQVAIPIGGYIRGVINKKWTFGIDICFRKTFTDYIDDVGSKYYDPTKLAAAYGPKAVEMADPNKGLISGFSSPAADGTPAQRGDTNKDSFFSIQITGGYILYKKRKSNSKARLRSKF